MDNQYHQLEIKAHNGIANLNTWQLSGRFEEITKYKTQYLNKKQTKKNK